MTEKYEVVIEYRKQDGMQAIDENGRPIKINNNMKQHQIEGLIEMYGLEPFIKTN